MANKNQLILQRRWDQQMNEVNYIWCFQTTTRKTLYGSSSHFTWSVSICVCLCFQTASDKEHVQNVQSPRQGRLWGGVRVSGMLLGVKIKELKVKKKKKKNIIQKCHEASMFKVSFLCTKEHFLINGTEILVAFAIAIRGTTYDVTVA